MSRFSRVCRQKSRLMRGKQPASTHHQTYGEGPPRGVGREMQPSLVVARRLLLAVWNATRRRRRRWWKDVITLGTVLGKLVEPHQGARAAPGETKHVCAPFDKKEKKKLTSKCVFLLGCGSKLFWKELQAISWQIPSSFLPRASRYQPEKKENVTTFIIT